MRNLPGLSICLASALATLGVPRTAWACVCSTTPHGTLPANGNEEVATNGLLVIFGSEPMATVRLAGPSGDVALTPTLLFTDGTTVSRRYDHAALAPFASYRIFENGAQIAEFMTGAGPDETPPPAPGMDALRLATAEYVTPSDCGERLGRVNFTLTPRDDVELYEIEILGEDEPRKYVVPPAGLVLVGDSDCALAADLDPGEAVCVRLTAIDAAGNRSPTDERCGTVATCEPIEPGDPLPTDCGRGAAGGDDAGCGCRVGGGERSTGAPLATLGLLGLLGASLVTRRRGHRSRV